MMSCLSIKIKRLVLVVILGIVASGVWSIISDMLTVTISSGPLFFKKMGDD